jgi:hypothetical protein
MELPEALAYFQEIGSLPFEGSPPGHGADSMGSGRFRGWVHLRIGLEIMQERQYDRCLLLNQGISSEFVSLPWNPGRKRLGLLPGRSPTVCRWPGRLGACAGMPMRRSPKMPGGSGYASIVGSATDSHRNPGWVPCPQLDRRRRPGVAGQAARLLRAIVAHGSQGARDLLIDDLAESASLSADNLRSSCIAASCTNRKFTPIMVRVQLKSNLVPGLGALPDRCGGADAPGNGARKEKVATSRGRCLPAGAGKLVVRKSLTPHVRAEGGGAAYIGLRRPRRSRKSRHHDEAIAYRKSCRPILFWRKPIVG